MEQSLLWVKHQIFIETASTVFLEYIVREKIFTITEIVEQERKKKQKTTGFKL